MGSSRNSFPRKKRPQWIERIFPRPKNTNFVLLGVQRSGTTLLARLLMSHPHVFFLGELFTRKANPKHPHKEMPFFCTFAQSIHQPVGREPVEDPAIIHEYLDIFYSLKQEGGIGFKLMSDQVKFFPPVWEYLKSNDVKVIRMVRDNILLTHISKLRAVKSGVWHSSDLRTRRALPVLLGEKVTVNTDSLIKSLDAIAEEYTIIDEKIRSLEVKSISVRYEELLENKSAKLSEVFSFLELREKRWPRCKNKKISPSNLMDSINNYEAVVETLKNSEYSAFLDG